MRRRPTLSGQGIWLAVAVVALAAPAAALDVTQCGQAVPSGMTGELAVDLDCPTDLPSGSLAELSAVYLEPGARLRLNGFTLSGRDVGVGCSGVCAVEGPGTIRDFPVGVLSYGMTRVRDVVFRENGQSAVYVLGVRTLRATNVTVLDSSGLVAVVAHRLRAEGLTIDRCWYGIIATTMTGSDIAVTGCGQRGIGAERVRASGLHVVDNAGVGLWSERVVLFDSVLTGNDTLGAGIDLRSDRVPRLVGTACGRSERGETGASWGVCQDD
jgi:hypothetical protein